MEKSFVIRRSAVPARACDFGKLRTASCSHSSKCARESQRAERKEMTVSGGCRRIRLQVWKSGEIYVTHEPLPRRLISISWKIAFASERVDSRDLFLRHKTTVREIYDRALQL